jgi:hypothetical protein
LSEVSRMQIAESVRPAFAEGPVSREQLLRAAEEAGAEPAVRGALGGLPEGKRFNALRDLWAHLHDVPVEPRA